MTVAERERWKDEWLELSTQGEAAYQLDEVAFLQTKCTEMQLEALNNSRTPGFDDSITAEVLKKGGEFIVTKLHDTCKSVFKGKKPPWQ